MQDKAKEAMNRQMAEEAFKKGMRSVYRPGNKKPGDKLQFMGHDRGYVVGEDNSLRRVFPKVKGKAARKADKRARRNGKAMANR